MKKHIIILTKILIIFTLIISTTFSSIYAEDLSNPYDDIKYIRVGLNYTSAADSEASISSNKSLAIWDFYSREGFHILDEENNAEISIQGNTINVLNQNGEELYYQLNGENLKVSDALSNGYFLVSSDYLDYLDLQVKDFDSIINFNGKEYRGGIGFYRNANETIRGINKLSIDEYTYGVINGEMNYLNPIEALKVQAVVVRSYALTNTGRHENSGFDVCDSTHCQLYRGYSDEYDRIKQAVDETIGLGMYYQGTPATGYFSKNSGGYTQNVEDVWGGSLGYLRSVNDLYSPLYTWETEFTLSELESKLKVAGYNIGELISIEIAGNNDNGSVAKLKFNGTKGVALLEKEKIRTILGATSIKSTRFEISSENISNPNQEEDFFIRGNILSSISRNNLYLLGADGNRGKINGDRIYAISGNNVKTLLEEETLEPVTGNSIIFKGKGSGHGVGLPQDSAIAMAKEGFSYMEILNFYYTDIEIK